ncbi:MAG: DUF1499 domain-containing protein [Pseudomonadota bacterium]
MLFIRFSPSDPARWHQLVDAEADQDMAGGAIRIVNSGADGLDRLDIVARKTGRTNVLAGSVDEGMITYVTRSKWLGFPDYTTATQDGDMLRLYGRLRFGRSDFGVNRQRLETWVQAIQTR